MNTPRALQRTRRLMCLLGALGLALAACPFAAAADGLSSDASGSAAVTSPGAPPSVTPDNPGASTPEQGATPAAMPRASITSTLTLKVSDREQVADFLGHEAEKLGGYFTVRSDDQIVLKVPIQSFADLSTSAREQGVTIDVQFETRDLGFELDQQRARLASREAMMGRYLAVLEGAGPSGLVPVQTELSGLIDQIEKLRGSLQLMEHELAYATLTVNFRFRDRRPPARDGSSSFRWLNTVNLADLVEDFRRGID